VYGGYDLDGAAERIRGGEFTAGADGFVLSTPFAFGVPCPPGHETVSLFAWAPDRLAEGSWQQYKAAFAEKLEAHAEAVCPGLSQSIRERVIVTPEDLREKLCLERAAYAGRLPAMGGRGPAHATCVKGLYFAGQQSGGGGGVSTVMRGAWQTAQTVIRDYFLDVAQEVNDE